MFVAKSKSQFYMVLNCLICLLVAMCITFSEIWFNSQTFCFSLLFKLNSTHCFVITNLLTRSRVVHFKSLWLINGFDIFFLFLCLFFLPCVWFLCVSLNKSLINPKNLSFYEESYLTLNIYFHFIKFFFVFSKLVFIRILVSLSECDNNCGRLEHPLLNFDLAEAARL